MFNFQSKKSIVGVLTLSATLALAGCESMSNLGSSNVDKRLTSGNQAEFFSKSGLTACSRCGCRCGGVFIKRNR